MLDDNTTFFAFGAIPPRSILFLDDLYKYDIWTSSYELPKDFFATKEPIEQSASKEPLILKKIKVGPTLFPNSHICSHNVEYRELYCDTRKRMKPKVRGITLKPRSPIIKLNLR